jgi:hypothetical protein
MGCGCSKNGNRNTNRSAAVTPATAQARNITPVQNTNTSSISQQSLSPKPENKIVNSADRRNVEKLRREAIRRALGR